VAISADPPEVSRDLCRKAGYTFTVLSVPNAEVIRRYHLLHAGGGPDGHDLARPAEFLVDSRGWCAGSILRRTFECERVWTRCWLLQRVYSSTKRRAAIVDDPILGRSSQRFWQVCQRKGQTGLRTHSTSRLLVTRDEFSPTSCYP